MTVIAGVTLAFTQGEQNAQALPKYAKKENKPCAYCHTSPSGGKRNTTGDWYGKHNHSFAGFTPPAGGGAATPTAKPSPKPTKKPTGKSTPAPKKGSAPAKGAPGSKG